MKIHQPINHGLNYVRSVCFHILYPSGCINVLFCRAAVAEPEYAGDKKPRARIMLRHSKPKNFIFFILMMTMTTRLKNWRLVVK